MRTLTPAERRARRAAAHHLHPVVAIGQHGLTPAVLAEIEVALKAHELIKVRVFDVDRDAREALLARICDALDAAPVQHLGKILTVWRPAPEPPPAPVEPRRHARPGTARAAHGGPRPERKRKRATATPAAGKRPTAPPGARVRGPAAKPAAGKRPGAPAVARIKGTAAKPAAGRRPAAPPGARGRGPVPGARRRRRTV